MRYRVRLTRVQTVDRSIRATNEDEALKKICEELERPYGFFASWETKGTDAEIIAAEPTEGITATLPGDGPLVLSVKEAAKHLGVSQGTLYNLINGGDLKHVRVGRRVFVARKDLTEFIETNTHSGYSEYYGR